MSGVFLFYHFFSLKAKNLCPMQLNATNRQEPSIIEVQPANCSTVNENIVKLFAVQIHLISGIAMQYDSAQQTAMFSAKRKIGFQPFSVFLNVKYLLRKQLTILPIKYPRAEASHTPHSYLSHAKSAKSTNCKPLPTRVLITPTRINFQNFISKNFFIKPYLKPTQVNGQSILRR